jgi:uncharacterized protein YndB with AHSA1/START domain
MDPVVERELTVPDTPEEVWDSLSEPAWLGDDAEIELRPDGEVRAGDRSGFVEEVEAPRRLTFWWSADGEESTRVEVELEEREDGTRVRVLESRPLALLDAVGPELALDLGVGRPGMPEMLARV